MYFVELYLLIPQAVKSNETWNLDAKPKYCIHNKAAFLQVYDKDFGMKVRQIII